MTAPKYHLTSYGCQMNKLDSELVESKLQQRGYAAADQESDADVVLINTCSVRQHAEDRVWSKLGKLRIRKRTEPQLVVGVLGCMAQEHQSWLRQKMPHVDLVCGTLEFGAIDQLLHMSGRSHRLITAMTLCHAGQVWQHTDITTLHMRSLDRAAIERYVAADQPLDCAGAYKLEAQGIALFERIESADHSAITGLPLIALVSRLRELGVAIP